MKPSHTPLPWKLFYNDGNLVNVLSGKKEVFSADFKNLEHDPAFIVRAVNAYERYREVLKSIAYDKKDDDSLITLLNCRLMAEKVLETEDK